MERRGFFKTLFGGLAGIAAAKAWPESLAKIFKPKPPETFMFMESTAGGRSGWFYEQYMRTHDPAYLFGFTGWKSLEGRAVFDGGSEIRSPLQYAHLSEVATFDKAVIDNEQAKETSG